MDPVRLDNLLVATDFSEGGDWALVRALLLPVEPRALITLVHVLPAAAPSDGSLHQAAQAALSDAVARAEAAARAAGGPGHARVVPVVAHGPAFVEVVREARRRESQCVILGRHGKGRPFRDLFVGSTAERVLRKGERPTLVVNAPPRAPYSKPMVAVDMSEPAARAAALARAFAPGAKTIDLLHAFHETEIDRERASALAALEAAGGHLPPPGGDDDARVPEPVRQEMAAFHAQLADGATQWRKRFRAGDPRVAIVDAALLEGADLLAVGTRGRGALATTLLGSVAAEVVRRAPCDVLVAKTGAVPGFELP